METTQPISGALTKVVNLQGTFSNQTNIIGNVSLISITGEIITKINITGQQQDVILAGKLKGQENVVGISKISTLIEGDFILEIAV